MQTVYKVVQHRLNPPVFFSPYVIGPLCCFYQINHTTVAPLGKLFAFKSLLAAKAFAGFHGLPILECKATGIQEPTFNLIPCNLLPDLMTRFWETRNKKKFHEATMDIPKGTVLCKSLTPIAVCKN